MTDPVDLDTQDYVHDLIMCHTINTAKTRSACDSVLHHTDLYQYLRIAATIKVELVDEASDLLRAFYVASRRTRVSSSHGPDVPIRALKSMYVYNLIS